MPFFSQPGKFEKITERESATRTSYYEYASTSAWAASKSYTGV